MCVREELFDVAKVDFNNEKSKLGSDEAKKAGHITARSVLISLVFLIAVIVGTQYSELLQEGWMLSSWLMPSQTGLLLVFLMIIYNMIISRFPHLSPFSVTEMVVAYVIIMVGGYVQTVSVVGFSAMSMASPWYAANFINAPTYGKALAGISDLLVIKDIETALGFWSGSDAGVPWAKWVAPIVSWTVFWMIVYFSMVCLATLVRRQWTEYDRMTYPLTIPVVAIMKGSATDEFASEKEAGPFWRNRILYIGMLYPIILGILHILGDVVPYIEPDLGVIHLHKYFKESPWNALGQWPPVVMDFRYPSIVGVAYFLNLQLLFSLWFFYFFAYRLLLVLFTALGYPSDALPILPYEIGRGAYLGVCLALLWAAREELKLVLKKAFVGSDQVDDSEEPLSYRAAAFGLLGAIVFIVLFTMYFLSMSFHIITYFLLVFFATAIGYARLRAQAGYPHGQALPHYFYVQMLRAIGNDNMTVNDAVGMQVCLQPMESGMAASGMGMALEAFTFGDSVNVNRRKMTTVFLAAVLVALVVGYIVVIKVAYQYGAINLNSYYHYSKHQIFYQFEHKMRLAPYLTSLGLGFVMSLVLWFLNTSFVWWPLYPVALGIASADWMRLLWFSFFLTWIAKFFILRYGGLSLHRKLAPAFYGMIVGSIIMAVLRMLVRVFFVLA